MLIELYYIQEPPFGRVIELWVYNFTHQGLNFYAYLYAHGSAHSVKIFVGLWVYIRIIEKLINYSTKNNYTTYNAYMWPVDGATHFQNPPNGALMICCLTLATGGELLLEAVANQVKEMISSDVRGGAYAQGHYIKILVILKFKQR